MPIQRVVVPTFGLPCYPNRNTLLSHRGFAAGMSCLVCSTVAFALNSRCEYIGSISSDKLRLLLASGQL